MPNFPEFFKSSTLASFILLIDPNVRNNLVLRLAPIPSTVSRTDCNPVFCLVCLWEQAEVVPMKKNSQPFYLLQRIQDEVHRFAITFHRQTRQKTGLQSVLDTVDGIGAKPSS
jgi:hypothetical protein